MRTAEHAKRSPVTELQRGERRLGRSGRWRSAQGLTAQSFAPIQKLPVRRPGLDDALQLALAPVATHPDRAVGRGGKQVLHPLELFAEVPVQLAPEGDVEKEQARARVQREDTVEDRDVPERQPRPHVTRSQVDRQMFSTLMMKPTPRTVWMSLTSHESSTFRRRRAMWTSITLSRVVARRVSLQT